MTRDRAQNLAGLFRCQPRVTFVQAHGVSERDFERSDRLRCATASVHVTNLPRPIEVQPRAAGNYLRVGRDVGAPLMDPVFERQLSGGRNNRFAGGPPRRERRGLRTELLCRAREPAARPHESRLLWMMGCETANIPSAVSSDWRKCRKAMRG